MARHLMMQYYTILLAKTQLVKTQVERGRKGDYVAFVETDQGVLINPQEIVAQEALEEIGQILKEKGLTLEELIESGREIRGNLIQEEYGIDPEK